MAGPPGELLGAGVVAVFGVLLWGGSLWILFRQQRELWTFAVTTGEVVRSEVGAADPPWYARVLPSSAQTPTGQGATDVANTDHRQGDRPVVEYEYTVAGETYTGDTIWPAGIEPFSERLWSGTGGFATRVVSRYVVGDEVTVHYDPDDPGTAFLRRDRNVVGAGVLLVAGTLPVSYAVYLLP